LVAAFPANIQINVWGIRAFGVEETLKIEVKAEGIGKGNA